MFLPKESKMFKAHALLIVLLVFAPGCSKETRKEYYSNGKLKSSCDYNKEGKLDGLCKRYSAQGYLVKEETYKDNATTGITREYHDNEDGELKAEGQYKFGKKDGLLERVLWKWKAGI